MTAQRVTKILVREWMKRVREDLREVEAALGREDWDAVLEYAQDASGAAAEIENMATVRLGEPDVTGSYR